VNGGAAPDTGPPLRLRGDDETLAELRAALVAADFTVERIESTLRTHALSARRAEVAVHLRRLEDDGPFASVAKLFLLGVPIDREAAQVAFAPLGLDRLGDLGLAYADGPNLHPAVRLVPHGDYYVASDLQPESGDLPADFVPGIQAPSVMLAKLVVRRRVRSALDLGTGCGIQALLAAKHSERVLATDVNPRALEFAAFNARLNGISGVEVRPSDTFDALEGERFDLIVSNPPYVISPDVAYSYRDNPLPGHELSRRIVEAAPAFLSEGGFAHLLVSWVQPADEWVEPLREWVADTGCDAWLLHYKTEDPLTHAANWLGPLAEDDVERFEQELERWLDYLRELEIPAVGYGAIVLRRRAGGRNWVREDALPLERLEPAGDHALRVFAAQDFLRELEDERALLDTRLVLVDQHRLEQTLRCDGGAFIVEAQTLSLGEGLGFRVGIDRYTTALLPHLDGAKPVRDVLALAAAGVELEEDERERFVPAALPVIRRLLELGFLAPAS
jgi:methyltransferase family protein